MPHNHGTREIHALCGIPSDGDESEEEAEEEKTEQDQVIPTIPDSRSHVLDRLRTLLPECLFQSEFSGAAAIEQTIMSALTWEPQGQELETTEFHKMLREVLKTLDGRLRRANNHWRCRISIGSANTHRLPQYHNQTARASPWLTS